MSVGSWWSFLAEIRLLIMVERERERAAIWAYWRNYFVGRINKETQSLHAIVLILIFSDS
jgi:hypothetical protein